MSKMIGSVVFSLVSRRSYGVYARAVNVQQEASAAAMATAETDVAAADGARATKKQKQDKLFWMRDPKTGCWVPENRFQEVDVDVVDLRNRLIRHE